MIECTLACAERSSPISPRFEVWKYFASFPEATELPNEGIFVPTFEMTSSEGEERRGWGEGT